MLAVRIFAVALLVGLVYGCSRDCTEDYRIDAIDTFTRAAGRRISSPATQMNWRKRDPSQDKWCGTEDANATHIQHLRSIPRNPNYQRRQSTRYIPVIFHNIVDGSTGVVTTEAFQTTITQLNEYYGPAMNLEFYLFGINDIQDGTAYNSIYSGQSNTQISNYFEQYSIDPNYIANIYTSDGGTGGGGWAYYYSRDSCCNGMMLNANIMGTNSMRNVVIHELGHHFSIPHTFQNGCNEPGDGIDDTPYENHPTPGSLTNCDARDTCTSLAGADPVENFMDYTFGCDKSFTNGQLTAMDATLDITLGTNKRTPTSWVATNAITATLRSQIAAEINTIRGAVSPAADPSLSTVTYTTNNEDSRLSHDPCGTTANVQAPGRESLKRYQSSVAPTGTSLLADWRSQSANFDADTLSCPNGGGCTDYLNMIHEDTSTVACTLVDCSGHPANNNPSTYDYNLACSFNPKTVTQPPYTAVSTDPVCTQTCNSGTNCFANVAGCDDCPCPNTATTTCNSGTCVNKRQLCCTDPGIECGTNTAISGCEGFECSTDPTCVCVAGTCSTVCTPNCLPGDECGYDSTCGTLFCGCPTGEECVNGACAAVGCPATCDSDKVCSGSTCVCPEGSVEDMNNICAVRSDAGHLGSLTQIEPDSGTRMWHFYGSPSFTLHSFDGSQRTRLEYDNSESVTDYEFDSSRSPNSFVNTFSSRVTTYADGQIGYTFLNGQGNGRENDHLFMIFEVSSGFAKIAFGYVYGNGAVTTRLSTNSFLSWEHDRAYYVKVTVHRTSSNTFFLEIFRDGTRYYGVTLNGYPSFFPNGGGVSILDDGSTAAYDNWVVGTIQTVSLISAECLTADRWAGLVSQALGITAAEATSTISVVEITESGGCDAKRQAIVDPPLSGAAVGRQATVNISPGSSGNAQGLANKLQLMVSKGSNAKLSSAGVNSVSMVSTPAAATAGTASTTASFSSSSSGLSTAAIIGIAAGGAVLLLVAAVVAVAVVGAVVGGVVIAKKKGGSSAPVNEVELETKSDPRRPKGAADTFDWDEEDGGHKSITARVPEGYNDTVQSHI